MASPTTDFGPEFLVIFIGYSNDASPAAETISALEPDLQRELDKLRRVNPRVTFNRVKMWKWDADAAAAIGGQATVITPTLQRANIAVFVFNERVGPVAWEELTQIRQRVPPVPVLPFFPANPPTADRMMNPIVAEQWTDLLKKRAGLAAGWTDPESNALTPLPQYKDIKDLGRISAERLISEVVRLASAFANSLSADGDSADSLSAPQSTLKSEFGLSSSNVFVGRKDGTPFAAPLNGGSALSITPGGEGRYTASLIPNLPAFDGQALVLDPTGQIYGATANEREKLGPVVKLDPVGSRGRWARWKPECVSSLVGPGAIA